jgi:hypothetical protein
MLTWGGAAKGAARASQLIEWVGLEQRETGRHPAPAVWATWGGAQSTHNAAWECREREEGGGAGRRLWAAQRAGTAMKGREGGRVQARAGCRSCSHQGRQVQGAMQLKRGGTLVVMGSALKTRPRNLDSAHQGKAMQGLGGKVGGWQPGWPAGCLASGTRVRVQATPRHRHKK